MDKEQPFVAEADRRTGRKDIADWTHVLRDVEKWNGALKQAHPDAHWTVALSHCPTKKRCAHEFSFLHQWHSHPRPRGSQKAIV